MYSMRISLFGIILYSSFNFGISNTDEATYDRQDRQERDLFKGFSGYRLFNNSFRMVYYHDLTIAVVEIGDSMTLLNCELIEVLLLMLIPRPMLTEEHWSHEEAYICKTMKINDSSRQLNNKSTTPYCLPLKP